MKQLFFLLLALLLFNCSSSKSHRKNEQFGPNTPQEQITASVGEGAGRMEQGLDGRVAIKQGITGKVVWEAGNQMPSPDAPPSSGKRGIKRTLYIYELTNSSQTSTTAGVFHTNIQTKLVTQVVTEADGSFTVSLSPGKYSLFTKEEKGLYANLFDGDNNIFPVEVKKGQLTTIEFLVNYNAHY